MRLIPDGFIVATQQFRIEEFEHITDEDGTALGGDTDHSQHLIRIATHAHPDFVADTLLHEILHVLLHKAGHGSTHIGDEPNELLVSQLTPYLLAFVRENQHVMKFLEEYSG